MNRFWKLGVGIACGVAAVGCGSTGEELGEMAQAVGGSGSGSCLTAAGGLGVDAPVVFRQGASVLGSTYSGATDAVIDKLTPATNQGSLEYCAVRGGSKARSCLMKWSLSALPTTTVVTRACVELYIDDPSGSAFNAYELVRGWNETTATWNNANIVTPWEIAGAQGPTDSGAAVVGTIPPTVGGGYAIRVPLDTALIQKWVSNASTNRGFVFRNASAGDGVSFEAKESPTLQFRPALLVFDGFGGL